MNRDAEGYICPHNIMCRCQVPECGRCGWNPVVAERRLNEVRRKLLAGEPIIPDSILDRKRSE